ncbi:unnamed protein product [Colias eurytheme]|nr:unnamed protein product [Colias eurytheme]
MFNSIKKFYNKENFDYSQGYVDPFKFHRTCYMFLKAFQVLDQPIPKWTYVLKTFILFCGASALLMLTISLYHGIESRDIAHITEAGTYELIMLYKLLIMSCTKSNLVDYHNLFRIIREDFQYVCEKGSKYRAKFFENQLIIWKVCLFSILFMGSVGLGMMIFSITALLWYLSFHKPELSGKRPLPFPFWAFETDFGKTPLYEICLIYSNMCVVAYISNYLFMMQIQILWIGEIATKADLVIWSIEDLMKGIRPAVNKRERDYFSNLIKYRMSEILRMHHSMIDLMMYYARVYTKLLMFEQKVCAPVVCLSAYCTTEKLQDGEFNAISLLLCIATIISVFIPSYLCNFLSLKVSSIGFACWNIPFWQASPVIRPYLVLIMQRSLRPLPIKAPGFEEVSIETFSNKMASAYSFYNMLRQANI